MSAKAKLDWLLFVEHRSTINCVIFITLTFVIAKALPCARSKPPPAQLHCVAAGSPRKDLPLATCCSPRGGDTEASRVLLFNGPPFAAVQHPLGARAGDDADCVHPTISQPVHGPRSVQPGVLTVNQVRLSED